MDYLHQVSFAIDALGIYLLCGLAFAIAFVFAGAGRIDPHAKLGSWGFRLLILPGTAALWPLLARRWWKGARQPPEEQTAHRCETRADTTTPP
jgi:hypothetical protein